jgi:hypothetical protein
MMARTKYSHQDQYCDYDVRGVSRPVEELIKFKITSMIKKISIARCTMLNMFFQCFVFELPIGKIPNLVVRGTLTPIRQSSFIWLSRAI